MSAYLAANSFSEQRMDSRRVRRLLATTDGSVSGEHAVEIAQELATRSEARLEVLSVETPQLPALSWPGTPRNRVAGAYHTGWASGVPGIEIVRRAKQAAVDLVILGRDDRAPQNPIPLGRTADTVVRRLDRPCLLIPPATKGLNRMVLALDGTSRGLGVLEPAARLNGLLRSEVLAVHVVPGEPVNGYAIDTEPAVERIREALSGFPELGGGGALQALRGAPVWGILGFLERSAADLLVLGVRGGGPCGDMGSGHIGRDLLRTAPVAILTIPI